MPSISDCFPSTTRHVLALLLLSSIHACSSSGSTPQVPESTDVESDGDSVPDSSPGGSGSGSGSVDVQSDEFPDTDLPTTGAFDLSQYLFHRNVLSDGGQISFVERIYAKDDSDDGAFISLQRGFVNANGIIEETSSDSLIKTFTISNAAITENLLDPAGLRISQRFANLGDVYLNADSTPETGASIQVVQNANCRLDESLETFDLSTATADLMLASGVYEDVIKVFCVTSFVNEDTLMQHTTLNSYFAKDIGIIFSEGEVLFLDKVFIIEEY